MWIELKKVARYIWFYYKYLKIKIKIENSKVKSLLDFSIEFNLIKKT